MKILSSSSIEDIAYIVCTTLDAAGCTAVLSGGGAATIYAPAAKTTDDLDFILQLSAGVNPDAAPLLELGFRSTGRSGIYQHPSVVYTLEFPLGPLAVGDELITKWDTLRREDLVLHIVTPTDCVRDRLAAAIHWNDFNSISQAVAVAKRHPVEMVIIERWCAHEGGAKQFETFQRLLTA